MGKYKIQINSTIVLYGIIFFIVDMAISSVIHPHMIVKEAEYNMFRSRSHQWPWSVMKANAISDAQGLSYYETSSSVPPSSTAFMAYLILDETTDL